MARHHRELECWQLADRVRQVFIELTAREKVRRDFDFCDQTNRSCRSACRNLAEGFYRYLHPDFARFVNIARSSPGELLDSTDEALEKRYIDEAEHRELNKLVHSALNSAGGLHEYLRSTPTPPRTKGRRPSGPRT